MATWRAAVQVVLHALAIAAFVRGFLLTKASLSDRSDTLWAGIGDAGRVDERLVVVVVDALRYDLALTPRMSALEDALARSPDHSALLRFRADAPTTTLQRLKALTTGTLPTFVEAGANFASFEVFEDSLVHQWRAAGRRVVFMGDDTWLGCFPGAFSEAYGYPSFDVWDLDTVDNGVRAHLLPSFERAKEWDVLIAHLLGVDHAGHRYGPDHPAMTAKLSETDALLREVIDRLPNGTLLAVLGDHGMTATGDHGGDSTLETDAALFLYRKPSEHQQGPPLQRHCGRVCNTTAARIGATVHQVDWVPTIAVLTGIAIPFSNVGVLIPSLMPNDIVLTEALAANARQLHRYLLAQASSLSSLPPSDQERLAAMFEVANSSEGFAEFLAEAATVCRATWTQFDRVWMTVGVAVAAYAALSSTLAFHIAADGIVLMGTVVEHTLSPFGLRGWAAVPAAVAALVLSRDRIKSATLRLRPATWLGPAVTAVFCAVFASNSFVVWEDTVTTYLLVSLLLVCAVCASNRWPEFGFAAALVRWTATLTVCREEQGLTCTPTVFPEHYDRWTVLACGIASVVLLWRRGGTKAGAVYLSLHLLSTAHWELDLPMDSTARVWLPRLCFGASLVAVAAAPAGPKGGLIKYAAALGTVSLLSGPFSVGAVVTHAAVIQAMWGLPLPPTLAAATKWAAAQHFFFRSGHQATLASIQWWPAFLGLTRAHVIVGGALVTLSFFGGAVLLAASGGASSRPAMAVRGVILAACMELTAQLRRHLMVWKIFAPRFIVAALGVLLADLFAVLFD